MLEEEKFWKMSNLIVELRKFGQVSPTTHPVRKEELTTYITQMMDEFGVRVVHFDIMDGEFVADTTIDYMEIQKLKDDKILYDFEFDLHLMIAHLEKNLDNYLKLNPETLYFHIKSLDDKSNLASVISKIRKVCKVGIVLDLDDEVDTIDSDTLKNLDAVLVMSVKIGKSGTSFNEIAIEKIRTLSLIISSNMIISVDGGLNMQHTQICHEAGARSFAYGSFLYKAYLETK